MNETKRDIITLTLGAIAIAVIGTASYFAFRSDEQRRSHLTAEVPAEIVEVYVSRSRNNEEAKPGSINNARISYHYKLNGETISRTTTVSGNEGTKFKVGDAAKVCYNPANPDEAELFHADYMCGK